MAMATPTILRLRTVKGTRSANLTKEATPVEAPIPIHRMTAATRAARQSGIERNEYYS